LIASPRISAPHSGVLTKPIFDEVSRWLDCQRLTKLK
jgi:hypothetical protein